MAFLYGIATNVLNRVWHQQEPDNPAAKSGALLPRKRVRGNRSGLGARVFGGGESQDDNDVSDGEEEDHEDGPGVNGGRGYMARGRKRVKTRKTYAELDQDDEEEEEEDEDEDEDEEEEDEDIDETNNDPDTDDSAEEDSEDDEVDEGPNADGEELPSSIEDIDEEAELEPTRTHREPVQAQLTEEEWAAERERRVKAAQNILDAGWSCSERALFNKLNMRGFEPLIPKEWQGQYEFSALPDNLFAASKDDAYLRNNVRPGVSPSPSKAIFCLKTALDLGPKLRCVSGPRKNYERTLRHALDAYLKWGYIDSGLWKLRDRLPVVAIVQKKGNETGEMLQDKLLLELEKLEKKWRKQLDGRTVYDGDEKRDCPQLYGIIFASSVMGLLSYVPQDRRPQPSVEEPVKRESSRGLRVHGLFNFLRDQYDVWNALALSIISVHLRNELLNVYTETGLVDELGYVEESDPDL